jgi:hypothetical protein
MEEIRTLFTASALLLSVLALIFTRKSWFESNRPIVTAEIVTHSGGSVAIIYNLVVHNTGTRPATDIRIKADEKCLQKAINEKADNNLKMEILHCFSDEGRIPLLHHQSKTSNGFGLTSSKETTNVLIYQSVIPIEIIYKDIYGKNYSTKQDLVVKDSEYFAGSGWS